MGSKNKRPQFFAICKNFNDGKIEKYDVLNTLFNEILTSNNKIRKDFCVYDNKTYKPIPITTKEQCKEFVTRSLRYHFWAKCEWEFIAIDWPHRPTIEESRPVKVDVFSQLEPNIPIIIDIVWDYIKDKIK